MEVKGKATYVILDVQVTAGFKEDTHHLDVTLVGSQVQGTSAILHIIHRQDA